jgi:aldehyde:ferredoxin oxidoreductase
VFPKLWTQPLDEGGTEGFVPDWEGMLREYYDYRAWDWGTGRPYLEKLVALGLEDIARDLWGEHGRAIAATPAGAETGKGH